MNVHISYKVPKTPDLEREINHNIEKLNRRLQVFRPELVHLHGIIEENSARQGFVLSLNLRLPSGQMAARESATDAMACIKAGFDDLVEEVTKHKDRLRSQHKWARRHGAGRTPPQPQVPFEETFAAVKPETVSDGDVTRYVNANLARLQRFIERELRYRQNNGSLTPDDVTREEVIDEVVVTALGDEEEKPQRLGLEPWLYRLALRAIDAIAAGNGEEVDMVSLDQPARVQNVVASDEPHLQFYQPDEAFTRRDVIPDRHMSTPEEIAASDEMITQVETALGGARREDRDAFILFAVEGFTAEEIAAISDRQLADVHRSITAARDHLKQAVAFPSAFKDKLLQHFRTA